MKKIILGFLAVFSLSLFGQDFDAMLKTIDEMGRFDGKDFSCNYTMVSEKPGEERSVMEIKVYRRDDEDKFLLLILKPEVDKGTGYLKVGDNQWMYDPTSRKFSHFSAKENVGDSESRSSDFEESSLADDYNVVSSEEGKLGKYATWILTLEAKNNEVADPKVKIWIRKDKELPLVMESYSLSDRKTRTQVFQGYAKVGENYEPSKMLIMDNLKEGEKTQISISNHSVATIPDEVFTKAFVEKVNR